MTSIEVSGSVPRFSRVEIGAFVRKVLLTLEKLGHIEDESVSEVSIAFVDDEAMRSLNRKFRHKASTTDVLTFRADDSYGDPSNGGGRPLGDIVISVDQARRQAPAEKHSLAVEVRYLILHGILHALGFDHETDRGEMNALEMQVRVAVGLD
ncbi:MAG: rRNA maturation RNase YbeY [Thermoanaerobaculia bacterium]